jgi:hypothetical protein
MQTRQVSDEQGRQHMFRQGKEMLRIRPLKEGFTRFRPLARPYPEDIRALVPAVLPQAMAALGGNPANIRTEQFTAQLKQLAVAELAKHPDIPQRVITEPWEDLVKATRQAIYMGGQVPEMEWWRHGHLKVDIGAWAFWFTIATFWGQKPIDVMDHCRDMPGRDGVFTKIFRQLENSPKVGHPGFVAFLKPAYPEKGFGVSRPQQVLWTPAFVFEHDKKVAPNGERCIVELQATAWKAAEAKWSWPTSRGAPPADFVSGYPCGNILDPVHGALFSAYNPDWAANASTGGSFTNVFAGGGGRKKTNNRAEYHVDIDSNVPGCQMPDAVSKQFFPQWDDIVYIPTRAEAWALALEATDPAVVAFAGRDEIDYLPATVRDLAHQWAKATGGVVAAPGFGAGAIQAPQPGAPTFAGAGAPGGVAGVGFGVGGAAGAIPGQPQAPAFGVPGGQTFGVPGAAAAPAGGPGGFGVGQPQAPAPTAGPGAFGAPSVPQVNPAPVAPTPGAAAGPGGFGIGQTPPQTQAQPAATGPGGFGMATTTPNVPPLPPGVPGGSQNGPGGAFGAPGGAPPMPTIPGQPTPPSMPPGTIPGQAVPQQAQQVQVPPTPVLSDTDVDQAVLDLGANLAQGHAASQVGRPGPNPQ